MKKKSLILGLVLSLGFAAAATTAIAVAKEPTVLAKADDASNVALYLTPNSNWTQSSARFALYYFNATATTENGWVDMTLVNGETNVFKATVPQKTGVSYDTVIFVRMDPSNASNAWNAEGATSPVWNQTNDLTYTAANGNLYTIGDGVWSKGAGTWSSYTEPATYTVSEYAVVDGVAEATAFATQSASGNSSFTPTDVARTGFIFGGWFTDSACTTSYTATTWSAAGNLYAKYTTVTARTVYFKTAGWTDTFVYSFGGDSEYGAWPGMKVTTITDGIAYQGQYGIVEVGLTKNDTKIIFNNGTGGAKGTTQTNDLSIVDGAYYWVDAGDGSTGDADKGSAAAVVYEINAARRAVTASSGILAGSLCGILKATAKTLVDDYDALNATAKGYADAATDYVYKYNDTNSSVDVTIADMVVVLRRIAATGSGAAVIDSANTNTTPIIVMVISLGVAAVAAAGLWISRPKEN